MADIVSEIIDDIQSDIDSGYYDLDNFDLYEAIWETLDNKLIYTNNIIEYWESTPGGASEEITRLMVDEITEYVTGSISDGDFNFPDDFTANRSHRANRKRASNPSSNSDFIYTSPGDVFEIVYDDDDQATGYPLLIDGEPASIEDFQDLGLSLTDTRVTRNTGNTYDDDDVSEMYENDNPQNAENLVKVSSHRANRKRANTEFIETVELGGGFSADIWFEPIGEFTGKTEYIYEVYKDGEAIAIGSTSTFDEAVSKAEFSAFNAEDYLSGGYGFDRSSHRSSRRVNRRRPHYTRHRANRRYATSNKTSLLSSEFSGMGWANGHTGLVGHFVAYDSWLWDMVRAGTISGPKELEREFMASRARELENMSDIDWSQVDWNDVYNFLSGK